MLWFAKKISENYAFEISFFHPYQDINDGITFFKIDINWNKSENDHCPRFDFNISLLNIMLIDFSTYNIHHNPETK